MNYYKDQIQAKKVKLEEKEDLEKRRHLWISGPPNCGKTWWKDNMIPEPKFEIPRNNDWTGYSGERNLWIDEFKGQLTIQQLNSICDGGVKVNCKCSGTVLTKNP